MLYYGILLIKDIISRIGKLSIKTGRLLSRQGKKRNRKNKKKMRSIHLQKGE